MVINDVHILKMVCVVVQFCGGSDQVEQAGVTCKVFLVHECIGKSRAEASVVGIGELP